MLFNVKLHVFMFLVLYCDVLYDFHVKKMFGSSVLPFVMYGINVLLKFFLIHLLVSKTTSKGNTMCASSGAGIALLDFTIGF